MIRAPQPFVGERLYTNVEVGAQRTDLPEIIAGLGSVVAGNEGKLPQAVKVFQALKKYRDDPNVPLPAGRTPKMLQFLAISAAKGNLERLCVWAKREHKNEHISDAVIGYYIEGKTYRELAAEVGVTKSQVFNLVSEGREFLLDRLSPWLQVCFPEEALKVERRGLGRDAQERIWKARHGKRAEAIRTAVQSDSARKHMSDAAKARARTPEAQEQWRRARRARWLKTQ